MKHRTLCVVWVTTCLAVGTAAAWGASLDVTTLDPNPVFGDARCSLVEAIENANDDAATHPDCAAGAGADIITLQVGEYVLDRVHNLSNGSNGLPVITGKIVINGNRSIIARALNAPLFRLFKVAQDGILVLNDLALLEGAPEATRGGGAILNRGGRLILNGCTVTRNRARGGGAIYNSSGSVTLLDSVIEANTADEDGGGLVNASDFGAGRMFLSNTEVSGNLAGGWGGGIYTASSGPTVARLDVVESAILENNAMHGGGIAQGTGGYGEAGVLNVVSTRIADNSASGVAGGVLSAGWSEDYSTASVTIRSCQIEGNRASSSGGIEAFLGIKLWIEDTTIRDNQALEGNTGGLLAASGSHLDLLRSTVSGNSAEGSGDLGGLGGGITIVDATADITSTTISGNWAMNQGGGGLWIASGEDWGEIDTTVRIVDSTIASNMAVERAGGIVVTRDSGGAEVRLELANSILAQNLVRIRGNASENCSFGGTNVAAGDGNRAPKSSTARPPHLVSEGYNLADDASCRLSGPEDHVVDNVMLTTLDDWGGPTMSHMPLPGSPAIDSGSSACVTDQRRLPRHADGDADGQCSCDRGAVERGSQPPSRPSGPRHDSVSLN